MWLALSGGSAIDERSEEIVSDNPPSTIVEGRMSPSSESNDDDIGAPGAVERVQVDEANHKTHDVIPLDNPVSRYEADDSDDDEW